MKKIVFVLAITAFTGSLWASSGKKGILRSLYDVVAPVISGEPVSADRQVGQIFYDNSAGAFKGVNKDGGIDTFSGGGGGALPKTSVFSASEDYLYTDTTTNMRIVGFQQEAYDTDSIYDDTTGEFTVPSDGYYTMSATLRPSRSYVSGDTVLVAIYKNSTEELSSIQVPVVASVPSVNISISADALLAEGDKITFQLSSVDSGSSYLHPFGFWGIASFRKIP